MPRSNYDRGSSGSTTFIRTDDFPANTATSGRVTVNGAASSGVLEGIADYDWFQVTLSAGTAYQFLLSSTAIDPFLRLYNGLGTPLRYDDDTGPGLNALIAYTPTTSGTYFLEASDSFDIRTGPYTIAALAVVDDFPASTTTPGRVTVNGAASSGSIENAADYDWFRVYLTAGTPYQVNANSTEIDPYLRLYNRNGALLLFDDDSGVGLNAQISYTPASSGYYYIEASDFYDYATGDYSVSVSSQSDDFAGNSSTGGVVAVNGNTTGRIDYARDVDWFKATLTAGHTYTIDLKGAPSSSGTLSDPSFLGVYTAGGGLVPATANDDFGSSLESQTRFTPSSTGTYYFAAGTYGSATGTYTLKVAETTVADIGNTTATAGTIAVNGSVNGVVNGARDVDWFKVTLTAGRSYIIDEISDQSISNPLRDPYFRGILDADGNLLAHTANNDYGIGTNAHVQFSPRVTGSYYLAAGGNGRGTGAYVLSISQRVADTDADIGNTTATTGGIAVGATGVDGSIESARDTDWYRVTLNAGQGYTVQVRGAHSSMGTLNDPSFIGVFDSSGAIMPGTGNTDANGTPDAQSSFTIATSGTYYLAVGAENDGRGTYRLFIANNANTDVPDNSTTEAVAAVGTPYRGVVDSSRDVDWIKVSLTANTTYHIQELGSQSGNGTLSDPYLFGIYNAAGQALPDSANDDEGSGRDAGINFTAPLTGDYFVVAGAYGTSTGSFTLQLATVIDATAPTLVSATPADNSGAVLPSANISLNFSEAVQPGSGSIVITGGGKALEIPITSPQVTCAGSQITINPTADLSPETSYSVTMAAGVVKDLAGNAFAGLTGGTELNFTTATPQDGTLDSWTIMVYMAADNNLEQFAIADLNEMESVSLPSNVNVVTYLDRAPGYDTTNGNWTDTRQGAVSHDTDTGTVSSFVGFTALGEQNTGAPANLTNFINWASANYASSNYALIIWDHGGGTSGSCWDDSNRNDHLTANELRQALDNANVERFDLIGFDACLMGMLEQAYELKDLSEVMVASEEVIPGDGWAYDVWLGSLAAIPSMNVSELAGAIVQSYGEEYAGMSGATLSAVRSDRVGAINTALNAFINQAQQVPADDRVALRTAASHSISFTEDTFHDLGNFMTEVDEHVADPTLKGLAANVRTAIDNAVIATAGTVPAATGISIYLPNGSETIGSDYNQTTHPLLGVSSWDDFLAMV